MADHKVRRTQDLAGLSSAEMVQVQGGGDDNNHGTHVAGTIGAIGNNYAPATQLVRE